VHLAPGLPSRGLDIGTDLARQHRDEAHRTGLASDRRRGFDQLVAQALEQRDRVGQRYTRRRIDAPAEERLGAEGDAQAPERLEEERRLMYVGITRARRTLAVNVLRRRKKGRDTVQAIPSRFIGEMKLHESKAKEDPREKLKALREAAARRAAQTEVKPT
jgi:ATP-dependent exoDNAse (exonuclease V) beta subunit